jgi:hypothetical protein
MDLEALKQTLRSAGTHPVQVEGSAFPSDAHGETVVGALDDFIEALKALRTPIVLICVEVLEESDFEYEPEQDEGTSVAIDLCREYPELERFKQHIGGIGRFRLFVPMPPINLNYYIQQSWHRDYENCWFAAAERVNRMVADAEASAEAANEARVTELVSKVRSLIDDKKFSRLPTQKAMLAYALDKIPGLDEIERAVIKEEIQELHARILARSG